MGDALLLDEFGLILDLGVLVAGGHEGGHFEVCLQHQLPDGVVDAVDLLALVADRAPPRQTDFLLPADGLTARIFTLHAHYYSIHLPYPRQSL